jgi:hypothetical protein
VGRRLVARFLIEGDLIEDALTEPLREAVSESRSELEVPAGLVTERTVDARRTAPRMRDQLDLGEGVGGADGVLMSGYNMIQSVSRLGPRGQGGRGSRRGWSWSSACDDLVEQKKGKGLRARYMKETPGGCIEAGGDGGRGSAAQDGAC